MPYFQRIQLIGVLGKDPEISLAPHSEVAHFSVCVEEAWKNKATGERQKMQTWFQCSAFGSIAKQVERVLKKGHFVFVEGRMRRKDKNDTVYWSVTVDSFKSMTPPSMRNRQPEPEGE